MSITASQAKAQFAHFMSTYAPYTTKVLDPLSTGGSWLASVSSFVDELLGYGEPIEYVYEQIMFSLLRQAQVYEPRYGGTQPFPNTPGAVLDETREQWYAKLNPFDLVNFLYGSTIPAATRTELVKQINDGSLSKSDFAGAFLTAKVTSGISVPTVDNILKAVAELTLTPDTVQFDDDHVLTHIYLGAFGRAPDGDGLAYWKAKVDEIGIVRTTEALYQGGLDNNELDGTVSNTAFVTAFYQSILGRAPDAGGLAFWVGKLDAGELDRGFAIHAFVEGTSDGRDAKYVNNKALVAQAFADATVGKPATAALLKAAENVLASVNEKDVTALAALDAIADGSAFSLPATTAKIATFDGLDAGAYVLFHDDTRDQTNGADDAGAQPADTHEDDHTGIGLVGVATADSLTLIA